MENDLIYRGSVKTKVSDTWWDEIDSIPAVDAVEKRHGAWVVSSTEHTFSDGTKARWNIWKCSRCPYVRTAGWEYTTEGQKPKARFCESCGARMDGEEEHNAAD